MLVLAPLRESPTLRGRVIKQEPPETSVPGVDLAQTEQRRLGTIANQLWAPEARWIVVDQQFQQVYDIDTATQPLPSKSHAPPAQLFGDRGSN